jgi:signal transduction histidine kinase
VVPSSRRGSHADRSARRTRTAQASDGSTVPLSEPPRSSEASGRRARRAPRAAAASAGAPDSSLVETLAAGVAHEVRNPLNSVQINLSILEQELSESLPDPHAHAFAVLASIAAEIKRLDDFVSEFLRFARPPQLKRERLAVGPLLTDLASFMTPECSRKGVRLDVELAGPDSAWVDGFQLEQAVLNLVLNALQATRAGGRIVVRTAGDKRRLVVAVSDDGHGMSPEVRERAFVPFFTTREGGTGLGLPLVLRIVQQHGGSIDVSSTPSQGTTVTLVLPAPRRP